MLTIPLRVLPETPNEEVVLQATGGEQLLIVVTSRTTKDKFQSRSIKVPGLLFELSTYPGKEGPSLSLAIRDSETKELIPFGDGSRALFLQVTSDQDLTLPETVEDFFQTEAGIPESQIFFAEMKEHGPLRVEIHPTLLGRKVSALTIGLSKIRGNSLVSQKGISEFYLAFYSEGIL